MSVVSLRGKRIGITAPEPYGQFLKDLLEEAGATPIWSPSIRVGQNATTRQAVREAIASHITTVVGIAFTSRNGIRAVAEQLPENLPPLHQPFCLGALGRDAQMLESLGSLYQVAKLRVPSVATPQALVAELGVGTGQKILCPVPQVVGLTEPDVVPNFLRDLDQAGWHPIRVNAYETAWIGDRAMEPFLAGLDAWIITSTAEVEGVIKSFRAMNQPLAPWLEQVLVAAHGPVTALGAQKLGVSPTVVSQESSSFAGVLKAIAAYWQT